MCCPPNAGTDKCSSLQLQFEKFWIGERIMANEDKVVTIIVEGTPHDWPKNGDISHEEVVELEVPDRSEHPEKTYSVKYTRGIGEKPEGILSPGASVKVKDGMVFSVSDTGES